MQPILWSPGHKAEIPQILCSPPPCPSNLGQRFSCLRVLFYFLYHHTLICSCLSPHKCSGKGSHYHYSADIQNKAFSLGTDPKFLRKVQKGPYHNISPPTPLRVVSPHSEGRCQDRGSRAKAAHAEHRLAFDQESYTQDICSSYPSSTPPQAYSISFS